MSKLSTIIKEINEILYEGLVWKNSKHNNENQKRRSKGGYLENYHSFGETSMELWKMFCNNLSDNGLWSSLSWIDYCCQIAAKQGENDKGKWIKGVPKHRVGSKEPTFKRAFWDNWQPCWILEFWFKYNIWNNKFVFKRVKLLKKTPAF